MKKLKTPTNKQVATRAFEESVFEAVAEEMRNGIRREGLWLKAFSDADADEAKAKSLYIKYRAQAMLDDAFTAAAEAEQRAEAKQQGAAPEPQKLTPSELDSQLIKAALDGKIETIKMALESGADVNARNEFGATPLFLATLHKRDSIARLLLERGANPKIPNRSGRSPLEVAEEAGYEQLIKILRQYTEGEPGSC